MRPVCGLHRRAPRRCRRATRGLRRRSSRQHIAARIQQTAARLPTAFQVKPDETLCLETASQVFSLLSVAPLTLQYAVGLCCVCQCASPRRRLAAQDGKREGSHSGCCSRGAYARELLAFTCCRTSRAHGGRWAASSTRATALLRHIAAWRLPANAMCFVVS